MTWFVLKAKCINSHFGAREQSLLWIFLVRLQEPSGKTIRSQRAGVQRSAWASTQRETNGMYGLLCESLHDFIKESYGDDVWKLVRERADVRLHSFVTHQVQSVEMQWNLFPWNKYFDMKTFSSLPLLFSVCVWLQVYSESVIPRIAKAASGVTGTPYNELMNSWGVYFLGFVGKYGYDRILKVENYTENCMHLWELLKKRILLNIFSTYLVLITRQNLQIVCKELLIRIIIYGKLAVLT